MIKQKYKKGIREKGKAVSPGGTSKGISETAQRIPYGSETGGRKQKSDGN